MKRETTRLTPETALAQLQILADEKVILGQKRFGINPARPLGVSMPLIRKLARGQRDHELAIHLWQSGYHEARILAALVDDPKLVDREQMEAWTADFDSWDICDQVVGNLFDRTPFAINCALEWSEREPEYTCRAGFVMMAEMAVHRADLPDETFLQFFPLIIKQSCDERNFVCKAVNWALRQMGKRSPLLWQQAVRTANQLKCSSSNTACWVAEDALRELYNLSQKAYIQKRWSTRTGA
ncbi:MAG: DNA alkylation repair protein [Anaerolineae bacterium]|nr:DNA alkylation repair protein [Anaerolineae bacterium]